MHLPPSANEIKNIFVYDRKEIIVKRTGLYHFAYQASSIKFQEWFRQYIKRLENWWLSGSKLSLVAIPCIFPYISPNIFPSFLQAFPVFLPVLYFRSYELNLHCHDQKMNHRFKKIENKNKNIKKIQYKKTNHHLWDY